VTEQRLPIIPYEFDETYADSARAFHPGARQPRALVHTYGCQMNFRDSEHLEGQLQQLGYEPTTDEEAADLILVNTCTVRETASQRVFGKIGELKRLKDINPDLIIGLCGCMAQEQRTVNRIRSSMPHVDLVFGTHNIHKLPELISQVRREQGQVIDVWEARRGLVEPIPTRRGDPFRAYVNIIYGCDKFCTYCIVPYTRGREHSRRPIDILEETQDLIQAGYRDITLLGQNVNSYGGDLEADYRFADLLYELDQIAGDYRLRYTTSHPKDFDFFLVDVIAASTHVVEHYHLPVQAGSNEVLRRMNRGYTREQYLDLVDYIREQDPGASITTDLIVGFPGETEEQFQETLSLVERVRFDNAYTFIYSPREGTVAARWEDDTPEEVKHDRLDRLMDLQHSISLEQNQKLEGQRLEVLVEGPSKKDDTVLSTRSRTNKLVLVHVPDAQQRERLTGELVDVRVTHAHTWTLQGELLDAGSQALT